MSYIYCASSTIKSDRCSAQPLSSCLFLHCFLDDAPTHPVFHVTLIHLICKLHERTLCALFCAWRDFGETVLVMSTNDLNQRTKQLTHQVAQYKYLGTIFSPNLCLSKHRLRLMLISETPGFLEVNTS